MNVTIIYKKEKEAPLPEENAAIAPSEPSDDFKAAYTKLNNAYNDHERDIEKLLFKNGADRTLPEMQNTADGKEIAAIIKTSVEFKPGKDSQP